MNYFSKKNIVIVVIAVLLIINIASISTIVYHSYDKKKNEKFEPERKSSYDDKRDLNFTPGEVKVFAEHGAEFREQIKEALVEMHHIRVDLINEMSSADPDTAKMFAMTDDIGRLHAQIKRSSVDHFLVLKNRTTPEQFEKFIRLFQRSIMDDNFGRWSRRQGQGKGPNRWSKGNRPDRNN